MKWLKIHLPLYLRIHKSSHKMSSVKLFGNETLYEILGVSNDASIKEGNNRSMISEFMLI